MKQREHETEQLQAKIQATEASHKSALELTSEVERVVASLETQLQELIVQANKFTEVMQAHHNDDYHVLKVTRARALLMTVHTFSIGSHFAVTRSKLSCTVDDVRAERAAEILQEEVDVFASSLNRNLSSEVRQMRIALKPWRSVLKRMTVRHAVAPCTQ